MRLLTVDTMKKKGIVNEVAIVRDTDHFRNFHLTIGIKVETQKKLTYKQGERLMREYRKDLLGKNIVFGLIEIPCPVCGKTFNTEQGTKQHMRIVHPEKDVGKAEKKLKNKRSKK